MERIGIDTLHKLFYEHPPNRRFFSSYIYSSVVIFNNVCIIIN